ncbi:helix-turn-helix domain-containing protein [Sporolactobacillus sp. THM19-2]|nr:helix-turn-helix domain-containing protein [Sporolactobacillus sp. THM19-2]
MVTTNEIGEKIAVARKLKNFSQAQLSEQLAVSAQAVGKWERGESMPDIMTFQRMATILGTDLNYFVRENDSVPETEPILSTIAAEEKDTPEKPDWNLSGGNWIDADFSGLHGLAEKFNGSNIEKCRFLKSDLAGLVLKGNNIRGSDFSRSDLSGCKFAHTNINQDTFIGCDFTRSSFFHSKVSDCDFSMANLTGVVSKWSHFKKVNLNGTVLYRTKFEYSQLTDNTFTGEITECSFENCDFARVIFDGAILRQCFFKNAKLKRATFVNCQVDRLTYAFMKTCKADLTDVTVTEDKK